MRNQAFDTQKLSIVLTFSTISKSYNAILFTISLSLYVAPVASYIPRWSENVATSQRALVLQCVAILVMFVL